MSLLGNGLSGLTAAQQVLNVASQNIANANTPGYSRQDAVLAARVDSSPSRLNAGNGVEVTQLRRIADDFRTAALWRASSQAGFDDQMQALVEQAEDIIGGSELSVSAGLDTLFAAFNSAAQAPQSSTVRQQIVVSAEALATRFNQLASNLDLQRRYIGEQSAALVSSINAQAANIAQLGQKIAEVQARGGNTSQLADQRDLAVQELAGSIGVRTEYLPDGRMNLSLPNGQPLVMGSHAASLSLADGVLWLDLKGQRFAVPEPGGQLGALQSYQNDTLAVIRSRLNDQAEQLATDLNGQLAAGYDPQGQPGAPLYQFDPADPAASLQLATGLKPEQLGFIGDDGTGNPVGGAGDNTNLLQVVQLKSRFYDGYTNLLGDLAIQSAQVRAEASASANLLTDAQNRRDSVSGVNQDEEAIRLMQFTQAYQANAKVISTAGRIFETLMGMF